MSYLPFQDTTVLTSKSQAVIIDSLRAIGFQKIMQLQDGYEFLIMAEHDGVAFRFSVDLAEILKVLKTRSKFRFNETKCRGQAERIAWRLLSEQVKSSADLIKYRVASIAKAFGGNLLIYDPAGKPIELADVIIADVSQGKRPGVNLLEHLK